MEPTAEGTKSAYRLTVLYFIVELELPTSVVRRAHP